MFDCLWIPRRRMPLTNLNSMIASSVKVRQLMRVGDFEPFFVAVDYA